MKEEKNRDREGIRIPGKDLVGICRAVQQKGGAFSFTATGRSMMPAICNGDVVTLSPLRNVPPFPGEVVAFRHPDLDRLVLHRVCRVKSGLLWIRGDHQRETDAVIAIQQVLGVVTRIRRDGLHLRLPDRYRYPLRTRIYWRARLVRARFRCRARLFLRSVSGRISRFRS